VQRRRPGPRPGEHGYRRDVTAAQLARWWAAPRRSWVFLVLLAAGACGQPTASLPPIPPSPVVGVVVRIDSPSLGVVHEFDVRTVGGQTVTLAMGQLENAVEFSPSHLAEHMATGVPVKAFYRLQDGRPTVYRLEDAVPASPAPPSSSPTG
jgi:hypothetical protein